MTGYPEYESFYYDPLFIEFLLAVDRTPAQILEDELFGKRDYIDTPGGYSEEKSDYEDVVNYYIANMGQSAFHNLYLWYVGKERRVRKWLENN